MTYLLALAAFLALWTCGPALAVLLMPLPPVARVRAAGSLLLGAVRCLLVLPVALTSPIVVPIALRFTPKEAGALPSWAHWWGNDVSINGDQAEGAPTYYAQGHDRRSFWARCVWLVLRNRASALALDLGYRYEPGDYQDAEHWGDPLVGRDREGWTVNRRGPCWQLYAVKRLGSLCIRVNCGFKVWANDGDRRQVAMVVNIPFSLIRWTGVA